MSDVLGLFFEDMGMLGKNGTSYLLGGIYAGESSWIAAVIDLSQS